MTARVAFQLGLQPFFVDPLQVSDFFLFEPLFQFQFFQFLFDFPFLFDYFVNLAAKIF